MTFTLPRLDNSNDFEELIRDLFSIKFKNPNLQRYGRNGQEQSGIDIVGTIGKDYTSDSGVVIQCKNHIDKITDTKLCSEIDTEISKFEKSTFKNDVFYFVTSAKNSKKIINHVKKININRTRAGNKSMIVRFWDDISRDVLNNEFLLYKYYKNILSINPPETLNPIGLELNNHKSIHLRLSDFNVPKNIKSNISKLKDVCVNNLNGKYQLVQPYNLSFGISTKPEINFDGHVDLNIDASEFFSDCSDLDKKYNQIIICLNNLISGLKDPFFSKKITILSDIEISLALLIGRIFRKHRIETDILFKKILLTTEEEKIGCHPSKVQESFLHTSQCDDKLSEDLIFVLSIALQTNINQDVLNFIKSFKEPYLFRSYNLSNGGNIENTSHANAIANDISLKLQSFQFLGLKRIHLFIAAPKPLVLLIGHKINTLNTELYLYFRSPDRSTYLKAGILKNNTFDGVNI